MDIEYILATASWRMRAWLAHPSVDAARVAWRCDVTDCLVAAWLGFELPDQGQPVVDEEVIKMGWLAIATPPLLCLLIDIIDSGAASSRLSVRLVGDGLISVSVPAQITAEEALVALAEAERRAARLQLPQHAESLRCCALGCDRRAWSPFLHGFLAEHEEGPFQRDECYEFAGRLCVEHWEFVVAPPPRWWSRKRSLASARA